LQTNSILDFRGIASSRNYDSQQLDHTGAALVGGHRHPVLRTSSPEDKSRFGVCACVIQWCAATPQTGTLSAATRRLSRPRSRSVDLRRRLVSSPRIPLSTLGSFRSGKGGLSLSSGISVVKDQVVRGIVEGGKLPFAKIESREQATACRSLPPDPSPQSLRGSATDAVGRCAALV
jgi:hypothetical protein